MARSLLSEVALREALRSLDEAIVALWASGIRSQGVIGRHVGLDQRSVSRRIARMVRRGAWPFENRPTRGRSQVPVATGFAAVPIGPERPGQPGGDGLAVSPSFSWPAAPASGASMAAGVTP